MPSIIETLQRLPGQTPLYAVKKIAEGDTVSVKVLKSLGSENYLVSFGGSKLSVKSRIPLSEGSVFKATVETSGEKILLKPSFLEEVDQSGLKDFLFSLGFSSDPSIIKIVQLMIQSGVKIDKGIIQKAKASSLSFPGEEAKAAEIATLLLEKGIEPTEENIRYFLLLTENNFTQDNLNEKQEQKETEDNENKLLDFLFYSFPKRKEGLLSLINHLKAKEESGKHFILIPYTWEIEKKEAKGLIRILIDLNLKTTEKICITFTLGEKKRFFSLYLAENLIKEIRFFTQPELEDYEQKKAEEKLLSLFNLAKVTYSSSAFTDGIIQDNSNLPLHFEESV